MEIFLRQQTDRAARPGTEIVSEVSRDADAALWAGDGERLRPGADLGWETEDLVDLLQAELDVLGGAGDVGEEHAELLLPRHLCLREREG